MRSSARAVTLGAPSSVRPVRALGSAVVAASLVVVVAVVVVVSGGRPARAAEIALVPAPSSDIVLPAPSPAPVTPEAAAPDAADPADATDAAPAAPSEGEAATATLADPAPVLEGPLRPKGDGPSIAVGGHEDGWTRSFDRGVRWTKGDTSLGITAAPGAGVRLGATFTH